MLQVVAPLYHEDGDMVDVFFDLPKAPTDPIRISDHGMTLMRLSYTYEIDTPTKRRILDRILSENGVTEENGRLYLDTPAESIYPALLQFAQTVAKVSNMQVFKKEIVQSLFYESFNDFVSSSLTSFKPQHHYVPLPDREELDVDWRLTLPNRDIFLFGVRDTAKARLVGLECLSYQNAKLKFRSVIVHEDLENGLPKKDQRRITNIADKQFATLADFQAGAKNYFERESVRETLN